MNAHGESNVNNKTQTYLISANLPESISYRMGSKWSTPFTSDAANGPINALMQFASAPIAESMGKENWFEKLVNLCFGRQPYPLV